MTTHVGRDPITWSFVKLFARHVTHELGEFEGVPGSHAWKWQRNGLWRARLVTKAQVVGVLVSVHERNERVEFLVDDGTALVKAVRWNAAPWDHRVALGDLVHVQGKLNTDTHALERPSREIRVTHIMRVDDPNAELLHWTDVLELAQTVYSAPPAPLAAAAMTANSSNNNRSSSNSWERLAASAFFELAVDTDAATRFITRAHREPHDALLVALLESLVTQQRTYLAPQSLSQTSSNSSMDAVRVTFTDALTRIEQPQPLLYDQQDRPDRPAADAQTIRHLRRAFAVLRNAGLLFLEDADADRHVLLSFALMLAPALLQLLRDVSDGLSIVELTEQVVAQRAFQRLPLAWLECALQQLLASGDVVQRAQSQRFHLA